MLSRNVFSENSYWQINIENAAIEAARIWGDAVVRSVFNRYDASSVSDLNPCYYSQVFSELDYLGSDT